MSQAAAGWLIMTRRLPILWLSVLSCALSSESTAGTDNVSRTQAEEDDPLVVRTTQGAVRGVARDGYRVFRGIPYAAPPVGKLRWRPPQPHPTWEHVRNTTDFGPTCAQPGCWKSENITHMSEDCLSMNVLTPQNTSTTYPVMMFIHAGEFHCGASNDLENNWPYFASDIVFVSFNFRLGVFGFLASDDLRPRHPTNGTGNYGMLDQRFALEWVHANIKGFGGDPDKVTIWGESSGGTSVAYHLTAYGKASTDLFRGAILQSPGLTQVKKWTDAVENYEYLLAALTGANSPSCERGPGYVSFTHSEMLNGYRDHPLRESEFDTLKNATEWCDNNTECLAFTRYPASHGKTFTTYTSREHFFFPNSDGRVAYENVWMYVKRGPVDLPTRLACVLNADAGMLLRLTGDMPRDDTFNTDCWAPVIDGVDLPETIVNRISQGLIAEGIDVLAGSNLDEGTEFMDLTPPIRCNATAKNLLEWCEAFFGPEIGPKVPEIYQQLERPLPICGIGGQPTDIPGEQAVPWMTAMRSAGHAAIRCPTRRLAKVAGHRSHGSTFIYHFEVTPSYSVNVRNTSTWGAFHGAEVPFVFGDAFELKTQVEKNVSKAMGCLWRNFAYYGDPQAHSCIGFGWPQFAKTGDYLQIGPNTSMSIVRADEGALKQCDLLHAGFAGPESYQSLFV